MVLWHAHCRAVESEYYDQLCRCADSVGAWNIYITTYTACVAGVGQGRLDLELDVSLWVAGKLFQTEGKRVDMLFAQQTMQTRSDLLLMRGTAALGCSACVYVIAC